MSNYLEKDKELEKRQKLIKMKRIDIKKGDIRAMYDLASHYYDK